MEGHVVLSFLAYSLTTLLLAQRDDQQTAGEIRWAVQGALLAWLLGVMGGTALQRKNALLAHLRHPLLQGMAGV